MVLVYLKIPCIYSEISLRLCDHEIQGTSVLFLFRACVIKGMLCGNLHKNESKYVLQLEIYQEPLG